jgi:hypothetical protein
MHDKRIAAKKSEKSSNQANQEDERNMIFHIYEFDDLYFGSCDRMKSHE